MSAVRVQPKRNTDPERCVPHAIDTPSAEADSPGALSKISLVDDDKCAM